MSIASIDQDAQVLVVGAGPFGIAVALELSHRGFDVVVIGRTFETWHVHTLDVMNLRTDPRGSSVWAPDDRFSFPTFLRSGDPPPIGDIVPVSLYRRYLHRVAEDLPFPVVPGMVDRLDSHPSGFEAVGRLDHESSGFRVRAAAAVVATGLGGHRHLPAEFRELPADRVVHSWDARRIEATRGRRVLVVGAGQSAAESALSLVSESPHGGPVNEVSWAVRRSPFFFREPLRLPTPLFKLVLASSHWLYRLPPPVLRTLGRTTFRTTITPKLKSIWHDPKLPKLTADATVLGLENRDDGVTCRADGKTYDLVVSATGYRYALLGLPFLSDHIADRLGPAEEPPRLRADFSCAVPDLYFVGGIAEASHGPAMRFVLGARHAARRVGRSLTTRLGK